MPFVPGAYNAGTITVIHHVVLARLFSGGGFLKEKVMPVPVTKYRCQFKCGTKAKHSLKDAEKHESNCYKNPDNHTCATCKNQVYGTVESYIRYRECKIEVMNKFLEEMAEQLTLTGTAVAHVRPLFNCPNWNEDEANRMTIPYLATIRPKIEQAHKARLERDKPIDLPF